jgi:hypothetical protein
MKSENETCNGFYACRPLGRGDMLPKKCMSTGESPRIAASLKRKPPVAVGRPTDIAFSLISRRFQVETWRTTEMATPYPVASGLESA